MAEGIRWLQLTVPLDLHTKLKVLSVKKNLRIPDLVAKLLEFSIPIAEEELLSQERGDSGKAKEEELL